MGTGKDQPELDGRMMEEDWEEPFIDSSIDEPMTKLYKAIEEVVLGFFEDDVIDIFYGDALAYAVIERVKAEGWVPGNTEEIRVRKENDGRG